jgi:hypothetical protein
MVSWSVVQSFECFSNIASFSQTVVDFCDSHGDPLFCLPRILRTWLFHLPVKPVPVTVLHSMPPSLSLNRPTCPVPACSPMPSCPPSGVPDSLAVSPSSQTSNKDFDAIISQLICVASV